MSRLRRRYGATPIHLLAHGAALALAAYALLQIVDTRGAANIAVWLAGAVIAHDLVLLPLYSGLDRAARRLTAGRRSSAVNYLRVPVGLSALLLLVHFPVISGRGGRAYQAVSGMAFEGYLERWLLITAVLFAGSGLLLVLASRRPTRDNGAATP